jgi:hypothetical protein
MSTATAKNAVFTRFFPVETYQAAVEVEGIAPLLMNHYCGEKPYQPRPRPQDKTQAWLDSRKKKNWMDAAYHDGTQFYIPGYMVEAGISTGATPFRKGKDVKKWLAVIEDTVPLFVPNGSGWKALEIPLEQAWKNEKYRHLTGGRRGNARIDICRPIFDQWRLQFTVVFDKAKLEVDMVKNALGNTVLGDWRARYGSLRLLKFEEVR